PKEKSTSSTREGIALGHNSAHHSLGSASALDPKTHPGMEQLSVPGSVVFIKPTEITRGGDLTQWWQSVKGANWREPEGPGSSIKGKENYPVVDVAYEDALAYAHWLGRELPTESAVGICGTWRPQRRRGRGSG